MHTGMPNSKRHDLLMLSPLDICFAYNFHWLCELSVMDWHLALKYALLGKKSPKTINPEF